MSDITGSGLNVVDTFVEMGGVTGTATTAQIESAMQIAWERVEDEIGTPILISDIEEEVHPWPETGRIMLNNDRVASVTTVIAKHDEMTCDCDVTDITGCATVVHGDYGLIYMHECYRAAAPCSRCGCSSSPPGWGRWVVVTYTAGLYLPGATFPQYLLLAVTLYAKDILAVLTGGTDEFADLAKIYSWRSMDYSETRSKKDKKNPFEHFSRAETVLELLKPLKIKRAVGYGYPRIPVI